MWYSASADCDYRPMSSLDFREGFGWLSLIHLVLLSTMTRLQIGAVDGTQGRYKEVFVLSFVRSNNKGTRIIKRTRRYETGINGSQENSG